MAHEIESMAYFGTTPWHKLGTPLSTDDRYDWQSACIKSGLDWEAKLVPLLTADTQAKVEHQAVRRKSDNRILGVVGPKYHVLQNREAFQHPLVGGEIAIPNQSADAQAAVADVLDSTERKVGHVDETIGRLDAVAHQINEVRAAAKVLRLVA